jgi:hypothetical protein
VVGGLLGLGLLGAAATAAAQGLTLTLTTSQAIYHAGEPLEVTVGADNAGLAGSADFYVAVLLPDGATLVSIGPGGTPVFGSLGNLAALVPAAAGVPLGAPFSVSIPGFLQRLWAGTEPLGSYRLFLAAVRAGALGDGRLDAGDLLALETLAVTLEPPVASSVDGSRTASAVVPRAGGAVTTTGADGTVYTLTVPPGALGGATAISVTPVTAIANLPLTGGLVAAAQLEPAGLQLAQPATLTLTVPEPVNVAGLLGFLYSGVGAGFTVLPVAVSGTTLTVEVTHFSTAGAAQGSLQDFAQQIEPLLAALPSTLPPTQVQSLVSLAFAWIERFGVPVCTGTDLCQRVFDIAQQSLAFHRAQACAQTFALIGQGEPFSARLTLAPVLRVAASLVELGGLAGNLGLVGFEEPVDFACVEGALRGIINLATAQAVADPRDGLLQLLVDLSADAALLALADVSEAALAGLRSALAALLGFGEQLCLTDPVAGEALLDRPRDLFGEPFLDGLDADLAERIRRARAGCRIRITPGLATVAVDQQVQFTGTVVGLSPASVTWSIEGPASGSTIDAQSGLFTAGGVDGVTVTVLATAVADPARFKRASVTVCAAAQPQTGSAPAQGAARAGGPLAQEDQCAPSAPTFPLARARVFVAIHAQGCPVCPVSEFLQSFDDLVAPAAPGSASVAVPPTSVSASDSEGSASASGQANASRSIAVASGGVVTLAGAGSLGISATRQPPDGAIGTSDAGAGADTVIHFTLSISHAFVIDATLTGTSSADAFAGMRNLATGQRLVGFNGVSGTESGILPPGTYEVSGDVDAAVSSPSVDSASYSFTLTLTPQ